MENKTEQPEFEFYGTSISASKGADEGDKARPSGKAPSLEQQRKGLATASQAIFSASRPENLELAPRAYGYMAGAMLGPVAAKVASSLSPQNLENQALLRQERSLDLAARTEKLKQIDELVKNGMSYSDAQKIVDHPFQFSQRTIKNAPAPRNYTQAMANTLQPVPQAVLEGVSDYKQGYKVAQEQRELDELANRVARRHGFGGYELTGEGVPPQTRPAQIGRVTPLFDDFSANMPPPSVGMEQVPSGTSKVGQAFSRPARYISNVLQHPVAKAGMTGAAVVGSGLQALSDVANKDWVGLGIDAAQLGLMPVAPFLGGLGAEGIRWSREHPEEFEKAIHEAYLRGSSPR